MPNLSDSYKATVRIPIQVRKGAVTYFYGGSLPKLKDGCVGDLIVPRYAVEDEDAVRELTREETKIVLDSRTPILFSIDARATPPALGSWVMTPTVAQPHRWARHWQARFVGVLLMEPLGLRLRGSKPAALRPCMCAIPSLRAKADSLNHAYSLISESFEPRRISHSGNVFHVAFYPRDGAWWPLNHLRGVHQAKEEKRLVIFPKEIDGESRKDMGRSGKVALA